MEELDDMGRIRVTAKLDGFSRQSNQSFLVASSILIHMLKHCWNTYVSIPTSMTGKVLLHCFVHCESVLAIPLLINEISSNIIAVDSCKRFESAFFRIILWAPLSWCKCQHSVDLPTSDKIRQENFCPLPCCACYQGLSSTAAPKRWAEEAKRIQRDQDRDTVSDGLPSCHRSCECKPLSILKQNIIQWLPFNSLVDRRSWWSIWNACSKGKLRQYRWHDPQSGHVTLRFPGGLWILGAVPYPFLLWFEKHRGRRRIEAVSSSKNATASAEGNAPQTEEEPASALGKCRMTCYPTHTNSNPESCRWS